MRLDVTPELTCTEVSELSGLYVLDALTPSEHESVRAHLATCPETHAGFAEVASVAPALAALIEPVDAPAALKSRVMAAIAAEAAHVTNAVSATTATTPVLLTELPERPREQRPRYRWQSWSAWGLAAAAVLVIAVLGSWSIVLQGRASQAEERSALIAEAIRLSADPDALVGTLRGSGPALGASGLVVFPREGTGYIVLVGLPKAPAGHTYQGWYLVDGAPTSMGVMSADDDGYIVMAGVPHLPGTDLIAVTIEPFGGVDQPTSEPIIAGAVNA